MKNSLSTLLFLIAAAVPFGCADEPVAEPSTEAPATVPASTDDEARPETLSEGFATPESVLYDSATDSYLVSNINGQPLDADDNGYITRINAEDHSTDGKWVDGETDETELNAPKGMAIIGDELWVTDIDRIRRFDRETGQPRGSIRIEGSSFLNDLTTGPDGAAYVADSGMKAGAGGFEPNGTDAIYRVSPSGEVETLASGPELHGPNGLIVSNGELWIVSFRSNELYRLVDGKKTDIVTLPTGGLDGIASTADGQLLISSWEGSAVYRGNATGPFEAVVQGITSPADIGVDSKRNLLLIPVFQEDRIEIHPLGNADDSAENAPPS